MEFVKAIKIRDRMCGDAPCDKCPLSEDNNTYGMDCRNFILNFPKKSEAILEKWAAEHPAKTRKQDLLEKHPNAALDKNGRPMACAKSLGYASKCLDASCCEECWNAEVDE